MVTTHTDDTRPSRSRSGWVPALLLTLILLPLYLAFRSISLDDFDSYSFALALREFSLDLYQPQPPGFPVYVFAGRVLLALLGDATSALTLLGALSGIAIALCIYLLGAACGHKGALVGTAAALLTCLTPMGWLTAEKALSDAPGMALTLLSTWALWRGRDNYRWFVLGCFVTGLSMGVRPQNNLPLLALLGGISIRHLWLRRPFLRLVLAALVSLTGLALWLLPTLQAAGGLQAYLDHLATHSAHVRETDSLFAAGPLSWITFRARWIAFSDTWLLHTVGIDRSAAWGWPQTARTLATGALLIPGLLLAGWRRKETWLLAGWALAAGGQVLLLEILDRPRLMLPILPPLALLIARGWAGLKRPHFLSPLVLMGTSFALLLQGAPLAAGLANLPAPPAQAVEYVEERYAARETVVAAAGSFRAAQVELPEYQLLYLYQFDPVQARSVLSGAEPHYVVIIDRDQFSDEAMDTLSRGNLYVPLEDLTFVRDPRIHTQHDRVRMQVLTPADLVPLQALMPPEGGCIDIGGGQDGRYLAQGWYSSEEIGGARGRWAGGVPTATLRISLDPGQPYLLTLRALAYPPDQTVSVSLSGQPLDELALSRTWSEYSLSVPASVVSEGVTALELVHAQLASPYDESGGSSSDRRPLAAAYDWICMVRGE
jgi:hypothetical protein